MTLRGSVAALVMVLLSAANGVWAQCGGDCNGDRAVTVDEVVTGVNIALGSQPLSSCTVFDTNGDGQVTVDEIITALNVALTGCGSIQATPTATATATSAAQASPTPPGPTLSPECAGGSASLDFSELSGVNSYRGDPIPSATITKGRANVVTGVVTTWGGTFVTCPPSLSAPVLTMSWANGGGAGAKSPTTGTVFTLFKGVNVSDPSRPTISYVDYMEIIPTNPLGNRAWRSTSGTLTILSAEGDRITFEVDAQMVPEPSLSLQSPATGTFRMRARASVDGVIRQ